MAEDYTFAEGYTFTQIVALWDCNPHDVAFVAAIGSNTAYWHHMATLGFVEADLGGSQITVIDATDDGTIWGCNNCGANSLEGADQIKHHAICKPGEGEYWTNFYSEHGEGGDVGD